MKQNKESGEIHKKVLSWWKQETYQDLIIEGKAGTGKTTLVETLIKELPACTPLLTATTNEAVNQLKNAVVGDYKFQTTHSALNFSFDSTKETPELVQRNFPFHLENYNLLIVDEASMVGEEILKARQKLNLKIIWLGHRNQLPKVIKNLNYFDKCESDIFKQSFPILRLTKIYRHGGQIADFCNLVESLIGKPGIIPKDYDISEKDFIIKLEKEKDLLIQEQIKVLVWTNQAADFYNKLIRQNYFGYKNLERFKNPDKILITRPVNYVGRLPNGCKQVSRNDVELLYANSKFEIINKEIIKIYDVLCYELKVKSLEVSKNAGYYLYVPIDDEDLVQLRKRLLIKAYSCKSLILKNKAFEKLHFILGLFAYIKYTYALTIHRSQGMTIPETIIRLDNINKCSNNFLKGKLRYVAVSRAANNLNIVR